MKWCDECGGCVPVWVVEREVVVSFLPVKVLTRHH